MQWMDVLMVLLFPLLDSIPYTLPRYWLFRDKLRIPFRYIVMLQLALAAVYSGVFYWINLGGAEAVAQWTTLVRYTFLFIFLSLAFLLIRDSFPKLMFTWLLLLSWQLFVLGNANYIESRFFADISLQRPYLVYNLMRVVVYLATCPFMLRFFYHTVGDALKIDDDKMWRHFWKIPLFSTLFGMLYCSVTDIYAYASWQFLASRYLMLLGTCYVSYVALKVMESSRQRAQLEEALQYADRNLLAQKKQYDALAAHMDEMRKARHDLRQHITVIRSYLEKDDRAGLTQYIGMYESQLPPDGLKLYCRHNVVNALVGYYAALARDHGISFDAKVDYPDGCSLSATDITVLLGNLLENAVEACMRETGEQRFIQLRVKRRGKFELLMLVNNSCAAPVQFDGDTPLSAKRKGMRGIGVASIQEIASRYRGKTQFEQKNGVFHAFVYLQVEMEQSQPPEKIAL